MRRNLIMEYFQGNSNFVNDSLYVVPISHEMSLLQKYRHDSGNTGNREELWASHRKHWE